MRSESTGGLWQEQDVDGNLHGENLFVMAVLDLIEALKTGREPELSGRKALQATELIFATYESSRRRERINLPLEIDDSPFIAMLTNADITTWKSDYVSANGIRMHYHRTGYGNKPALVLCHGYSDNSLCWTPVARALEKDYDVIMLDARCHGLSDAPSVGNNTETRAEDVAAFVQVLNLEKPAILGHSMGAATAALSAAKYPKLYSKVLLEDPPWWDEDSSRSKMTKKQREEWVKERREKILNQNKMSRSALAQLAKKESPWWSDEEIGPWTLSKQQLSPNVMLGSGSQSRPWREVAKAIQVPTLLITGNPEKGAIVTPKLAEKAKKLNTNVKIAYLDAEHSIRREVLAGYLDIVNAFLKNN
jgi:pimeloyl-ACP methyl ester carboxylesterase